MARLAPKLLELNLIEQEELEKIVARHGTSQQVAKRAKIILMASEGKNHRQIARELDISRKMARLWRDRWLQLKPRDSSSRKIGGCTKTRKADSVYNGTSITVVCNGL